ncbi:hypothetical protein ACOSQ2_016424 [Xanthoceras sorbifolium]
MDGFCSNQVSDCCDYKRHGYSKAQACLKKILEIISSIEEAPVRNPSLKSQVGGFSCGKKGFDIDLNLSLVPGPFWESGEYSTESLVENGDLSASNFVCKEEEEEEEKTTEVCSVITKEEEEEEDVKTVACGGEEEQERGSTDCLGLLIAAAELISRTESGSASGDKQVMMMSHDDDEIIKNNKKNWRVDEDQDTSAELVRAKRDRRRRSQILPHRYRDSVLLQPWKRLKTAIINPRSRSGVRVKDQQEQGKHFGEPLSLALLRFRKSRVLCFSL